MKTALQHALSLLLPLTVLIVVPWLIEPHPALASGVPLMGGMILLLAGLLVVARTIGSFAITGKGTLAPWSPPRHLVIHGMYAYVRNPMILGVITVLLGEAVIFRSWSILIWAAFVFFINTVYFMFSEEPGLEKRFGEEYRQYKRNVPRWLPRRTPWKAGETGN